jgi:Tfp pilus assembly protein PilV
MGPFQRPGTDLHLGLPAAGDLHPIPDPDPAHEDGANARAGRSGEFAIRSSFTVTTRRQPSRSRRIFWMTSRPALPRVLAAAAGTATKVARQERGTALVESLVASVLLGLALLVLVGSYSTFAIASTTAKQVAIGQTFGRAQAARIKAAPYQANGDYSAYYDTVPSGLSRSLSVTWWDGTSAWSGTQNANGLEKLVLTITYSGDNVSVIEFVKGNR